MIGSGISGALTAFELTENGVSGSDIVILEAREAASGATSRNAGHVRPGVYLHLQNGSNTDGSKQMLSVASSTTLLSMDQNKPSKSSPISEKNLSRSTMYSAT